MHEDDQQYDGEEVGFLLEVAGRGALPDAVPFRVGDEGFGGCEGRSAGGCGGRGGGRERWDDGGWGWVGGAGEVGEVCGWCVLVDWGFFN